MGIYSPTGTSQNPYQPGTPQWFAWTPGHPGSGTQEPAPTPTTPGGPVRRSGYLGLIDEYNDAAKKAYDTALGTLYRRRDYARTQLQGAGETALQDNSRSYSQASAGLDNSLVNRGLYSSTVRDALQNRNRESKNRAAGAIREGTAKNLAEMDSNLTGDIATLQYANRPNEGIYSSAIQGLAGIEAEKKRSKNDLFGSILGGGLKLFGSAIPFL